MLQIACPLALWALTEMMAVILDGMISNCCLLFSIFSIGITPTDDDPMISYGDTRSLKVKISGTHKET